MLTSQSRLAREWNPYPELGVCLCSLRIHCTAATTLYGPLSVSAPSGITLENQRTVLTTIIVKRGQASSFVLQLGDSGPTDGDNNRVIDSHGLQQWGPTAASRNSSHHNSLITNGIASKLAT